jgi:hypothetical protein
MDDKKDGFMNDDMFFFSFFFLFSFLMSE